MAAVWGLLGDLADLELRHRRPARREGRIHISKQAGLMNLPLHGSPRTASSAPWSCLPST